MLFEMSKKAGNIMHDEQPIGSSKSNYQADSVREQHLVEQITKQLQLNQQMYSEYLAQIILALPDEFKKMAIHTVAEQFVTIMKMHLFSILATFHQKAESENINVEERNGTLQDVEAEISSFMEIIHRLTVNTPDMLFRLGTITASIQDLSKCDSAEEAQRWLYHLPAVYQTSLEREYFLRKPTSRENQLQS